MPAPRSRRRARLAALVSVVLAITGFQFFLAPPAAQANPGGTALVISEVYGGGGNAGATYDARLRRAVQPDGLCDPVAGHVAAVPLGGQHGGVAPTWPA